MSTTTTNSFDFSYWRDLAKNDPQAFEKARQEAIEKSIAGVGNPDIEQRLRGLQWRIDMVRQRSKNPMESAIRIYDMMWESVAKNYEELQKLAVLLDPAATSAMKNADAQAKASAKVLQFKTQSGTVG